MTSPPDPVQRVAEVLRRHPPVPDDLSRVRAERNVVQASRRALLAPPPSPRRRTLRGALIASTLTAAAAAAVVFSWGGPDRNAPTTGMGSPDSRSTARERMEASLVAEGMPAQGETLRTGAGQRMRARIGASEVELESNTSAHFERLAPEELRVRLRSGALGVTFHPKPESEQQLVITTRAARVEVVGTVFRVEVDGADATGVWVEEGKVRVVPTAQGTEPRLVSQGESLRVEPTGMVPVEVLDGSPTSTDTKAAEPDATAETGAGTDTGTGTKTKETGATAAKRSPGGSASPHGKRKAVRGRVILPGGDHLPGFVRAKALLAKRRFQPARRLLRKVADQKAESRTTRTRAWILIAESYEEEGNHTRAAEAYGKASWFGTRTRAGLEALFRLGQLREGRLGDARGARNAYTRYLQQAPHGPKAPHVRRALCRLGDRSHC